MLLEAIKFWSENSYEHIEVIQAASGPAGAILYQDLASQLETLHKSFKSIYDRLNKDYTKEDPAKVIVEFLTTNDKLIETFQRIKFEGLNGFPILYEAAYHFLYEQLYINQIFKGVAINKSYPPKNVLINGEFRGIGLGNSVLECIYGQMYFWSLIGAEHPSLLMNVTTTEMDQLPKYTIERMITITNDFNNINYLLSQNYEKMNMKNIIPIFNKFKGLNEEFLGLLKEMQVDPEYLPHALKSKLPKLFFGVMDHIMDEHTYVLSLCFKIDTYLGTGPKLNPQPQSVVT